jgi:hypothetical protein
MIKKVFCGVLAVLVLNLGLPASGRGAVIPADVETAAASSLGAPSVSAAAPASAPSLSDAALDRAEAAQRQRTDLTQQGGDALVGVLAVVGIVAIVIFFYKRL